MTNPAHPDPEHFAADDRFVRALLRRFVADPNVVDDLAQETWLAALKQSAGGGPFLGRAWLSTVARNCALQTLRGNQRRLAREARAAAGIAVEGPAEARGDADLHQRVLRAVAELDERYREVVRLRFFEDLLPSEIAQRLSLPVETVRTRCKRGLSRIHRSLLRRPQ